MVAARGGDLALIGDGDDVALGGPGRDRIILERGDDLVVGASGASCADRPFGGPGADCIRSGKNAGALSGGGGGGADALHLDIRKDGHEAWGERGADIFAFGGGADAGKRGRDIALGFNKGIDALWHLGAAIDPLEPGPDLWIEATRSRARLHVHEASSVVLIGFFREAPGPRRRYGGANNRPLAHGAASRAVATCRDARPAAPSWRLPMSDRAPSATRHAIAALPDWVEASAKLSPADRRKYARVIARAEQATRGDIGVRTLRNLVSMSAMKDLAALGARNAMPYPRFERSILDGDAARAFGAESVETLIATRVHAARGIPSRIEERAVQVEAEKSGWVCAKGCWLCCVAHETIAVLPAEARAVWAALAPQAPWVPIHPKACPALGPDGACRAYDSRPAICRGLGSADLGSCQDAFAAFARDGLTHMAMSEVRWPYAAREIAKALSFVAERPLPWLDLISALRALREGKTMSKALEIGRARTVAAVRAKQAMGAAAPVVRS